MNPTFRSGSFSTSYQHNNANTFQSFSELTDNEDSDSENETFQTTWKSRPAIWSDDTRMNALFAPFRKRDLNPLHYDNKMKFWKELIIAYSKEKQMIQIDLKTLESCFIRKKIKPKCLEPVLNQLILDQSFKTRNEILKPKLGIFQTVLSKCIWSPLSWTTNYILDKSQIRSYIPYHSNSTPNLTDLNSSTMSQKIESEVQFVNVELVEAKSAELLNLLKKSVVFSNVDCLIEYNRVYDISQEILSGHDNEKDLDLLIKYLEVNKKIVVFDLENNKKCIKFAINSQNVTPVTEIELSYVQLKETEAKLESETNRIENEINALNDTIKAYLKQNNRSAAMKHLKKRKQLDKTLESKDNTLSNIQAMLMSIQQADTNKITVEAYNKSANALKEANKDINMDKLDDTMQDLQEMMQVNTEVEEALKSPISNRYNLDESELNSELAELLETSHIDEKSKLKQEEFMDMTEVLNNLPMVPDNTPKKKIATHDF